MKITLKIVLMIFCGLLISGIDSAVNAQATEYEMLISSRNTNSVKRFNAQTGDYIDDFVSPRSGGLSTTQDLKIGPDGNILVSGRGNTNILVYDKVTGDFIQSFTSGYQLDNPTKITFGPDGNLYVSQWGTARNKVVRFSGTTGEFIDEFTPSLNLGLGHAWDSEGNLYVACYGSKDVRKFDTNGNFIGIFTETGHLQGPTNVWFDGNGNLFVVDWVLGSVQQFNASTGAFIKTFVNGLQNAEGYAFGQDGNLYICDWSKNLIKRFSPDGNFIDIFTNQGNILAPNSILFRPVQVTSIEDKTGSVPDNFFLEQNFPNPFNPSTKIKFGINKSAEVKLSVFNILGQEISSLLKKKLEPGIYEVDFDGSKLNSGIYLYAFVTNEQKVIRKMTLVK